MLSKEAGPFDFAGKQLEFAQKFCETAPHNDNCSLDLEKVQESFRLVLEVAESQVAPAR